MSAIVLWNLYQDELRLTMRHMIPILLICYLAAALWGWLMWYMFQQPAQAYGEVYSRARASKTADSLPGIDIVLIRKTLSESLEASWQVLFGTVLRTLGTLIIAALIAALIGRFASGPHVLDAAYLSQTPERLVVVVASVLAMACIQLAITLMAVRLRDAGPGQIRIREDKIELHSNGQAVATYRWSDFGSISETRRAFYLRKGPFLVLTVPKRTIRSAEELSRVRELLNRAKNRPD